MGASMVKKRIPPTFSELVGIAEGRVTSAEAAEIRERLDADPHVAEDLAWLTHVIDLMRSDESVEPPLPVVQRAVRLFAQRAMPPRPNMVQRIVAVLRFDSASMPLAVGVRSGQPVPRQLVWSAEPYDIDLRITPHGDTWQVSGQVLGPCTGGQVTLGDSTTVDATLNDLCEFALPPVPAGRYALALHLTDAEITIDMVEVGT